MAGFNLYINCNPAKQVSAKIPSLKFKNIWDDPDIALTSWVHDGYPWRIVSEQTYEIYIEGKVYNYPEPEVDKRLSQLVTDLRFQNTSNIEQLLNDFDGDYVLVVFDKQLKKISILNDIYARLPVYYAHTPQGFVISRNQLAIVEALKTTELDRFAIAELLLFGFFISDRTLIEGISKLSPSTLYSIDLVSGKSLQTQIFSFNFDNEFLDGSESIDVSVKCLANLFNKAVKIRAGQKNILGLSGGLDSRVIAASLSNQSIETCFVSRLSSKNEEQLDVLIAKELAKLLGIEQEVIACGKPQEKLSDELLALKVGLNDVGNRNNLAYEQKLLSQFGSDFTYLTGCGGDWLKPLHGTVNAKTSQALVEDLLKNNASVDAASLFSLLNIDQNEFVQKITSIVSGYPENSMSGRYLHLLIYSYGFRYDFEGEDRKRNFFWTTTPFFSNDFFKKMMHFTQQDKAGYKVYFNFMRALNQDIMKIQNKDWGKAPDNKLVPFMLMLREQIKSKYKIRVKSFINRVRGRKNIPDQRILKLENGPSFLFHGLSSAEICKELNVQSVNNNLYTVMRLERFLEQISAGK